MPELQQTDVRPLLIELGVRWGDPAVPAATSVVIDKRLRRTLGRADVRSRRIAVAPAVLDDPSLLREVIAHELAHVVAYERVGASERAHGPTWAALMRSAGLDARVRIPCAIPDGASAQRRAPAYDHRCPVCHASRRAKRPVPTWRCVDCSAAGLPGELEISRRPDPR